MGKNSVRNLQYGPRTRLVRGIYWYVGSKALIRFPLSKITKTNKTKQTSEYNIEVVLAIWNNHCASIEEPDIHTTCKLLPQPWNPKTNEDGHLFVHFHNMTRFLRVWVSSKCVFRFRELSPPKRINKQFWIKLKLSCWIKCNFTRQISCVCLGALRDEIWLPLRAICYR